MKDNEQTEAGAGNQYAVCLDCLSELMGNKSDVAYNEKIRQIYADSMSENAASGFPDDMSMTAFLERINQLLAPVVAYLNSEDETKKFIQYFRDVFNEALKKINAAEQLVLKEDLKNLLISCVKFDSKEKYEKKFYASFLYLLTFYYNDDETYPSLLAAYQKIYERISKLKQQKQFHMFYADYARLIYMHCRQNKAEFDAFAVDLALKALEVDPTDYIAEYNLGRIYRDFGTELGKTSNESNMLAETYFQSAINHGSTAAISALKQLRNRWKPELSLGLMNTDVNLSSLISQFEKTKIKSFSMLLYGAHGSGRQEFAEQLLKILKIPHKVLSVYDNDIAGLRGEIKGVANNECAYIIKYMEPFCDVKKNGFRGDQASFLLEDMLKTNILPIIFIVDNIERLEPDLRAAFTFKISFGYMDLPQKEVAFDWFFHQPYPESLKNIDGLVINDFIRVRQKAKILECSSDAVKIGELLREEAEFKLGKNACYISEISFDSSLINADVDLDVFTQKLTQRGNNKFSMLIYGPPGTGKSYYLRYLAEKLGMKTMERTAADLFSTYQGEPARNVVAMFKEAEKNNAMIILDEVDEILKSRASSEAERNSWKVDMINAFLTQMDRAAVPIVCTTNFIEKIDTAIMRRFVFKMKFDYLTAEQNRKAFKYFFKMEPPVSLFEINNLANGDYLTVKRQSILLDYADDAEAIIKALREEAAAKTVNGDLYGKDLLEFDVSFLNTDVEKLERIANLLCFKNNQNAKIIIHGPVGSGKVSFAQYLAKQLNMNCLIFSNKDFISRGYVDYDKIVEVFKQATEAKAVLVFNNVTYFTGKENLFRELKGYLNSFQNNATLDAGILELIQNYEYPLIFTTANFRSLERNDALRQFINFDIEFGWLKGSQIKRLYRTLFGFDMPFLHIPFCIMRLTPLFLQNVLKIAELLGVSQEPKKVYRLFKDEVYKNQAILMKRFLALIFLYVFGIPSLIYLLLAILRFI